MAGLLDKFASAYEAYNHFFHDLSRPVADVFGLKNLGPHFDTFVYSFILFNFASTVLVPGLSTLFFNRIYGALDAKVRNKWYAISPHPSPALVLHSPEFRNRWGGKCLHCLGICGLCLGYVPRN